jgi:hypothetical protein
MVAALQGYDQFTFAPIIRRAFLQLKAEWAKLCMVLNGHFLRALSVLYIASCLWITCFDKLHKCSCIYCWLGCNWLMSWLSLPVAARNVIETHDTNSCVVVKFWVAYMFFVSTVRSWWIQQGIMPAILSSLELWKPVLSCFFSWRLAPFAAFAKLLYQRVKSTSISVQHSDMLACSYIFHLMKIHCMHCRPYSTFLISSIQCWVSLHGSKKISKFFITPVLLFGTLKEFLY